MQKLEIIHKKLIRKLGQYDAFESLWVIYSYFQNAYYDRNIPLGITPNAGFLRNKWATLESSKAIIAMREIILYCGYSTDFIPKGIMHSDSFGEFWNTLNSLNGEAYLGGSSEQNGHPEDRVYFELYRIAQQQFKWQSILSNYEEYINVYYYLFSDPDLDAIIRDTIGLSVVDYYIIGYVFLGSFLENFALKVKFSLDESLSVLITEEKMNIFIEKFSIDIEELRKIIKKKQLYDEGFEYYGIVDLLNRPLIQISKQGESYFCSPILPIFIKSLAEGIYFRCLRSQADGMSGSFGSKFGLRFQKLCELNISRYLQGQNIKWGYDKDLSRHDRPGHKGSDTDFFFVEDNCLLFLESKTKIIPESCYITTKETDFIKELDTWVNYLCQCYFTINRYLNGDFEHCIPSGIASIYPIIVTPNDLYFWFDTKNSSIIGKIDTLLVEVFRKNGLDPQMIEKYPYAFLNIQQLPLFISLIDKHTITRVMETFVKIKHRHYNIDQMAKDEFGITEQFGVVTEVNLSDEISRLLSGT